ncbi:hypothetical protein ACIBG8_23205 [Nonomuraea sp. NPDC050556]|uniref:hypothetical protein n=1 Tax=Nonomuraea sp. NPDC050556 TaxID=3364369 RepID=UPI00379D7F7B
MIPDFDPKKTRRAVRRGVLRTALTSALALAVVAVMLIGGLRLLQTRGDREERMEKVLGTALQIAKPAYHLDIEPCCDVGPLSMSLRVSAQPIRAIGAFNVGGGSTYEVRQNFFGRVEELPWAQLGNTDLTTMLANVGGTLQRRENIRKVLARLPQDMNALAVVELAQPMADQAFRDFLVQAGTGAERVAYEVRTGSVPITWDFLEETALSGFRAWVGELQDHDEPNLRRFDLDLARLRKAAKDGLAYAFVTDENVADLRKLIEDPRVRTVRLADLAFDLERP